MRARVDVGVVTWNTRDLTVQALRRLLDTEQGADVRLLVHDNASSDGTVEALQREVPEADVVAWPENLGFAAAVNKLLERSTAPWFLTLNSDAWPTEGAIGALVAAAERHPRAAALAPRLERPDGALEHSTHPFPSLRVAALTATGAHRHVARRWGHERALNGVWQHDLERPVDWAVGAALLLRSDAVAEVGGFDESFFMYVEDLEWCHRARAHGWEIWFTPKALVVHVGNASGEQRYGGQRTMAWATNTYRFYLRHHGRVATRMLQGLNVAGAWRAAAAARVAGDGDRATFWRDSARAHRRALPR